jgi:hypothetical protein
MNTRRLVVAAIALVVFAVPGAAALAAGTGHGNHSGTLPQQVQDATRAFKDQNAAKAAGYASAGSCVSSPEEGAMGIHWGNADLINDGKIAADKPELLIYEPRSDGSFKLLGVEYLVTVDAWGGPTAAPPVLVGQHFQFVNAPNRYGLPAFYELHVWAWKHNEKGTFSDFNPAVSCVNYTGEVTTASHTGH